MDMTQFVDVKLHQVKQSMDQTSQEVDCFKKKMYIWSRYVNELKAKSTNAKNRQCELLVVSSEESQRTKNKIAAKGQLPIDHQRFAELLCRKFETKKRDEREHSISELQSHKLRVATLKGRDNNLQEQIQREKSEIEAHLQKVNSGLSFVRRFCNEFDINLENDG